jgi:pimeloyl-ACP methyl ester carboxylesterase
MLGTPPELLDQASDADRERVSRMLDYVLPVTERRAGLLNDGVVTTTLDRYDLEHVEAPTLVISAEDDLYGTFERARYTADEIPHARFVGFADGGHLLVGRQEQVTVEIAAFLRAYR